MSTLLDVTPNEAAVSVKGGITKHRLHCVGKQRLAFKVMVSTKRFMSYSFKPVMGFITPGEFRDVIIKHVPGTRKSKDTISIAYIPAPTGNDAHQIFDEAEEKRRVKIKVHVVDPEPEELNETDYRAHFDEPGVLWNKETLDDKGEDNDKDVQGAAAEAAAVADAAAAGPRVVPALTIDPPAASFPNGVGTSVHQLTNPSRVRVAFKIKSSNNRQYYLNPVFGFIEPNASAPLEVNRVAGPAGTDKLVVLFKEAPADAKDAYTLFKEGLELGKIIIPLMAGTVAGAGASDGVQGVADPVQDGGLAAARNAAPLAAVQSEAGRAAQGGGAGITANAPVPAGEPQRKN